MPPELMDLLREPFGHPAFRPHQEEVCRAAAGGADVLLVMPTGAGKSLGYQLPGLARPGPALVVSPLIALMEDQVAKLAALGLRAERIHSGRSRAESRAVCFDYLEDRLDYLFIAPERLRVPGFPEMLAKRTPSLVAIDEAHCISQWGHDFRPDYRLLGERLPALRPAPIVAATATATPRVQDDIVAQLGMRDARRYICGFRRTNLGIEVREARPSERADAVERILDEEGRRPAIVYAPTRKETEALAGRIGKRWPCAPYHAGLGAERRDEVQTRFSAGDLDVIVATIAFGMGIDKADVRTVVHTAMPGDLESYYQEIGRAGRDGAPSRAVLLWSWADRRTRQFFLDKMYPPPDDLEELYDALGASARPVDDLGAELGLAREDLEPRLERLRVHGGATVDRDGRASRGRAAWKASYLEQRSHREEQLAGVGRYVESPACRMLGLIHHFGDRVDPGTPCGQCDVCEPRASIALAFRAPDPSEREDLERILAELRRRDGQSAGRLHREGLGGRPERRAYEALLDALARAGLVVEKADSFEKDGKVIEFRRVFLTREGEEGIDLDEVPVLEQAPAAPGRGRRSRKRPPGTAGSGSAHGPAVEARVEALTRWRRDQARETGVPAYRILTNAALRAVAVDRPASEDDLLEIHGIGPATVHRHGEAILRVLGTVD